MSTKYVNNAQENFQTFCPPLRESRHPSLPSKTAIAKMKRERTDFKTKEIYTHIPDYDILKLVTYTERE